MDFSQSPNRVSENYFPIVSALAAYVVLLIILIFFDQAFVEIGPGVSIESRLIFYSMNISAVSVITFFTIHYFISEQIKEKRKNIELLDITRKNKLEIESQYELLTEQRDALEEEQNKTQRVLQKIETLFGQQVSKEVVKELVNTEGEIDSKLCNVTVMFLDIRDFTSFADSRLPEDVASFQNIVFGELINIVQKYKGIINQILGDGIMPTLRPTKAIDELDYFRFDWVLSASNRYRLSTEIVS